MQEILRMTDKILKLQEMGSLLCPKNLITYIIGNLCS